MSPASAKTATVSRLQGAITWLLVGLVFTLGLLAASPAAHARLHAGFATTAAHAHSGDHAHDAPPCDDDSACAISLFQCGVTPPLALPHLSCPHRVWSVSQSRPSERQLPAPPTHRLQPARGPPAHA